VILKYEIIKGQHSGISTAKYLLEIQPEVVNIYTDRDLYLTGETIWFTAHCLFKENHEASPLSNVLYIELFNAEKKSVRREKFRLEKGKVTGSLPIPEELISGDYYIRAYTQYLRNFPSESYFTKWFTVINPVTPINQSHFKQYDSIEIIPDGITLVNNFPARVGIRIPDKVMKAARSFIIVDQNHNIVSELKPYANGLAAFNYMPNDSTEYFLKVELANENPQLVAFPLAHDTGFSIQTEWSVSELRCKIAGSNANENLDDQLRLAVFSGNSSEMSESGFFNARTGYSVSIPLMNFDEGINYLVLTDSDNKIKQFKSLFLNLNESIEIPIQLTIDTISRRERIGCELISPFSLSGDTAFLTASVVMHGTNIEMNDLLPPQFIANPLLIEAYLRNSATPPEDIQDQIRIALYLKSRESIRLISSRLLNDQVPLIYLPEIRDVSVSGFVREKGTGLPAPDVRVFASVLFRNFQIHSTITNEDGSFIFSLNFLSGNHDLYFYAEPFADKELELFINNDFSGDYPDLTNVFLPPDSSARSLIEQLWVNQQVSQKFPDESKVITNHTPELPFLFGNEMLTVKPDDYVGLNTMKEVFNEIIPWVRLNETGGHYRFSVFDKASGQLFNDPLILLDHIPLPNADELIKIHPSQVSEIGVVTGAYALGNNIFQGVISIKTKSRDFSGINFPDASAFAEFQTISSSSTLSFPRYDIGQPLNEHIPDFRTLLYWEPEIALSSQNIPLNFYSSDHCAVYDIIVRGYTRSGKYCYGKTTLKVVK
jgi:hypothetical protein